MPDEKRNKPPTELTTVGQSAPAWLTELAEGDTSMVQTVQYKVLSRLKIVQGQSRSELKALHPEGTAIMVPGKVEVAAKGKKFRFVPLLFFPEYTAQSDIKDKASPFISDRSFDPKGDLARKARDPALRKVEYGDDGRGGKFRRRHVEHLCFVGMIYDPDHPLRGQPLCISFEKGEFMAGSNWITALRMRRIGDQVAPLWSQVWEFNTAIRKGSEGDWYGLDYANPAQPYVTQEEAPNMRKLHMELKAEFESLKLMVDRDDEREDEEERFVDAEAKVKETVGNVDL